MCFEVFFVSEFEYLNCLRSEGHRFGERSDEVSGKVNMVQSLGLIHASTHLISFSNDATDDIFLHISSCLQKNLKCTVILGTSNGWF